MSIYEALYITFTIVLAAAVGRDAFRRGMNARSWVLLTLLFSLLIIPLYLFLRTPLSEKSD